MPTVNGVKRATEKTGFHGASPVKLQALGVFVGQETAYGNLHKLQLALQASVMINEGGEVSVILCCFGDSLLSAVDKNIVMQLVLVILTVDTILKLDHQVPLLSFRYQLDL